MNFGLLHSIATACPYRNLHPGYLKKPCYIHYMYKLHTGQKLSQKGTSTSRVIEFSICNHWHSQVTFFSLYNLIQSL